RARPDLDLPHVAHVEEPCGGARVEMFLQDAGAVLHRHLVPGEGHHLGSEAPVEAIERCRLELGHIPPPAVCGTSRQRRRAPAPLLGAGGRYACTLRPTTRPMSIPGAGTSSPG